MNIDLTNKKVLVTGASRGIGKAIAQQFLLSGADVGIHFNSEKELAEKVIADYPGSSVFKADLSKKEETLLLFDDFISEMGGIDVLVNNAGIAINSKFSKSESETWLADWDQTMRLNLIHPATLSMLMIDYLRDSDKKGRIINIASRAAFRGDTEDYLALAASKGGLVAFTRSIARSFGKSGIMSFNIAPGFTRTEMAQGFIDKYGEEFATNDISLPSLTTPEDIAPAVVFFASGLADHATGCTLDINAGSYLH